MPLLRTLLQIGVMSGILIMTFKMDITGGEKEGNLIGPFREIS